MTSKEIQKLLKDYLDYKRIVLTKQAMLEDAQKNCDMLKAIDYTKVQVKGGAKEDITSRAVFYINKIESDFMNACDKLFEMEDRIAGLIDKLDVTEQNFVIDRYMKDVKPIKLSKKYNYSIEGTYNKFNKIYKKLSSG